MCKGKSRKLPDLDPYSSKSIGYLYVLGADKYLTAAYGISYVCWLRQYSKRVWSTNGHNACRCFLSDNW